MYILIAERFSPTLFLNIYFLKIAKKKRLQKSRQFCREKTKLCINIWTSFYIFLLFKLPNYILNNTNIFFIYTRLTFQLVKQWNNPIKRTYNIKYSLNEGFTRVQNRHWLGASAGSDNRINMFLFLVFLKKILVSSAQ